MMWLPGLVIHGRGPAFSKGANGLLPGANRQTAHAGISTISSEMGEGTGSPCFLRLAT